MSKPILVLKIGTASITTPDGDLDQVAMVEIARQVSQVHSKYNVVIVSSGAVGTGKNQLKNYQGGIIERKAAAAIGNPLLLNKYAQFFAPYNIFIAQSLCERTHFSNSSKFSQLRQTFHELWKNNIIPIANENDVVSNLELKFSDNDELATLLAVGFGAEVLLIGTSVDGVYDKSKTVIPEIANIDKDIMGLAHERKSSLGLGGMISKLTFSRLATKLGVKTIIFNNRIDDGILKALNHQTGTVCLPHKATTKEQQDWLASGNIITGKLEINSAASDEIKNQKNLSVSGVTKVLENFEKGEIFEILNGENKPIALARAQISSKQIVEKINDQSFEIAAAQEIVLL